MYSDAKLDKAVAFDIVMPVNCQKKNIFIKIFF
jgi:hypothetical protein